MLLLCMYVLYIHNIGLVEVGLWTPDMLPTAKRLYQCATVAPAGVYYG